MASSFRIVPLLFVCAGVLAVSGCDSPTTLDPPTVAKTDPARGPSPPPATGLTATELLADPLLHLMLGTLRDPVGAGAITAAIDATRVSLTDGDTEAARSHLEDAYTALTSYLRMGSVDDEDVIHLDAAERFLDEVEALIDTGGSRGKKKK